MKSFAARTKTSNLIKWSAIAKSSYYYRSQTGKRGRKPSTHTRMQDGDLVSNNTVVLAMRFILAEEFVCYGYIKTTDELKENGFVINYKKTYRLMKEHRLLCGRGNQSWARDSQTKVFQMEGAALIPANGTIMHGHQICAHTWAES